jgi:predicted house-cleaning NTP pyrophosphatase (Maf/HAM1 superfamily)
MSLSAQGRLASSGPTRRRLLYGFGSTCLTMRSDTDSPDGPAAVTPVNVRMPTDHESRD